MHVSKFMCVCIFMGCVSVFVCVCFRLIEENSSLIGCVRGKDEKYFQDRSRSQ